MVRSRWSLSFVKKLTMCEVSSIEGFSVAIPLTKTCRLVCTNMRSIELSVHLADGFGGNQDDHCGDVANVTSK